MNDIPFNPPYPKQTDDFSRFETQRHFTLTGVDTLFVTNYSNSSQPIDLYQLGVDAGWIACRENLNVR